MDYEIISKKLRELQLVQLEILIEFDRICKANNLGYQLFAGTLLGAVRHKGFIPWDDDIDVCMLREDYNKFLDICNSELGKKYFLQTHETDPEYIHSFARIRKNDTLAVQKIYADINMHHGIFIDVFPLDNISPDMISGKIQYKILYPFRKIKFSKIKHGCLNPSKRCYIPIKLFFHYLLKPFSMQFLNRIETKIICMYNCQKTKYITHLTCGTLRSTYKRYIMKKEDFYNVTDGEFEGHRFPIPIEYNKVLTKLFGNYMQFPPINERKPHHGIIKIDFNTNG